MRKSILILILSLVTVFSQQIYAQEKKNLVKTSLVFPLAEVLEISYERILKNDKSLQLNSFIGGKSGFGLMPEFRFYLSENKHAPTGIFIAPYAIVAFETSGAGLMVGAQQLFKDKISIEASLGPMLTGDGVAAMGGINIGFAF
ncbi:MAG: hypothetical protein H6540_03885 [Bacteroidales bacterium]|nr:hypothetical protein [Bacteroidales bacterium]MCB9014150.1 hypothetical protein [Bacteroidales bacterium]